MSEVNNGSLGRLPMKTFSLGRNVGKKDIRNFHVRNILNDISLPATYDLRFPSNDVPGLGMGKIYDQKDTGSCVSFAWANVAMWQASTKANKEVELSQEFIYYEGRKAHGYLGQDGMDSQWGCEVLKNLGDPLLSLCPYQNTDNDTVNETAALMADAATRKVASYAQCTSLDDMKQSIYQLGPICIGIPVYESFMDASGGVIPMPGSNEALLGGHELAVCGWTVKNGTKCFVFKNSWYNIPGIQPWGDNGFGYLPEAYMTKYLSNGDADSFTVTPISPPVPNVPHIIVAPLTVEQGKNITITGTGFIASGPVSITIARSQYPIVYPVVAKADGSISISILLDAASFDLGPHGINAKDDSLTIGSNIVTITVKAPTPPVPPVTERYVIFATADYNSTATPKWVIENIWFDKDLGPVTGHKALAAPKNGRYLILATALNTQGVWTVEKVYFQIGY